MDMGLLRDDFNKLLDYAKKNYIWYDTYEIKENAFAYYDKIPLICKDCAQAKHLEAFQR